MLSVVRYVITAQRLLGLCVSAIFWLVADVCHAMLSTKSVAVGFGRHDMPPPASNDTGTALGRDGSD